LCSAIKIDADKLKRDASSWPIPDEAHNSVVPAYLVRSARFPLQRWFE
jgi:hypothetical protein